MENHFLMIENKATRPTEKCILKYEPIFWLYKELLEIREKRLIEQWQKDISS